MNLLKDFQKAFQMTRKPKGDIKFIFEDTDKDIIDRLYNSPQSEGLHLAGVRELGRRYSTRLYYASLFAGIFTVVNLLITILHQVSQKQ